MDKFTVKLTGTLTSLSPITIVPPSADEIRQPDGSKYKRVATNTIYTNGLRDTRPIIPGSTLRGSIRRAATNLVRDISGSKISLEQWHQNAVGGIKGAETENGFDVMLRQKICEKNPILSLFGAGSPWLVSRAYIDNAVPDHSVDTDLIGGVRSDDGRRDNDFFAKLDDDAFATWVAMVSVNADRTKFRQESKRLQSELRSARKNADKDAISTLETEVKALENEDANAKALASNPVSMPLLHEAIPAGVTFNHAMTLKAVTEAEIGLFFAALNYLFLRSPNFGQHRNVGYGLVRGQYEVSLISLENFDPLKTAQNNKTTIGTMILEPETGITEAPDYIQQTISSFGEAYAEGNYNFDMTSELEAEK